MVYTVFEGRLNRMNVSITNSNGNVTTTFSDVLLNTSNPITDYSVYLEDDYDGGSNSNIFWKQTTSIVNTANNTIGGSNNSYTISTPIENGLDANSTTVNSVSNTVTKTGTGTITLTGTNTYTGLTTVSAGTLVLNKTGGGTIGSTNNVTINGGTLQISADQTLQNLTLSSGTLTVDANKTLTIRGTYSGGGTINNLGTIVLNGTALQNFPGATTTINNGIAGQLNNLTINNSSNVSLNKSFSVAGALALTTGNLDVNGQSITLAGTVSGAGSILATGTGSTVIIEGPSVVPTQIGSSIRNFTINKSAGVSMGSDLIVTGVYTASSGKLSIAGNTLTLNGTVSGMSASNSFTGSNTSKIAVTSTSSVGTIFLDQTTSADVATTNGTNALQNVIVNGTGGSVTLGNKLNLFNRLSVGAGTLNTGGNLVLRSTASNTAYVDVVGGSISGQVTVERYYHKQFRSWRAVTAPVTFNGIVSADNDKVYKNWESSFGFINNYGTRISSNVTPNAGTNGLDDYSTSANLMTYNSSSAAWNKVNNTLTETMSGSTASAANKGFFLFVRGDRTVLPTNPTSANPFVATTLATKGLIQTGTQTFNFTGVAGNSWLTGNPYPCPVDMSLVSYTGIPNTVYIWDPNLSGALPYISGSYTYFDRSNWNAGPFAGSSTKFFQSGQAFFVKPTSGSASITYSESNKAGGNNNTQTTGIATATTNIMGIRLYYIDATGNKNNIDGVRAKYGNYSTAIDEDDIIKLSGSIESISLGRGAENLAMESRPYITGIDDLNLKIQAMSVGANYEFTFNPINFDASVSNCKLVDNFLNIETPISLTSNTTIGFNITNVAGSSDANRFKVVFNAGALPFNNLKVKAFKMNNTVLINWEATEENNVKNYAVEKSVSGANFETLTQTKATNNNATNTYSSVDNNPIMGVNYYRIKTTATNSNEKYSAIVRVEMNDKGIKSITVYPNPVTNNIIGLQLNNITAGAYTAKLFNTAGQEVYTNILQHNGNNGSISLNLNKALTTGTYQLQISDAKGTSYKQKVLLVE